MIGSMAALGAHYRPAALDPMSVVRRLACPPGKLPLRWGAAWVTLALEEGLELSRVSGISRHRAAGFEPLWTSRACDWAMKTMGRQVDHQTHTGSSKR